ncbi:MAG TPA: aminotransferase class V-fold PLP-dependent enzyme, partial [bacterium]|nr:aminotransferase class V-fold PLP-dependent enzyme [bacterium]
MAYLDRITGTRTSDRAVEVMMECLKMPGANPQSPSRLGSTARRILDTAREQVAGLIGSDPREITFVSNGTESVNLAIRGLLQSASRSRKGRKIIVSSVEHVSVLNTVKSLEKQGFEGVVIPVDATGRLDFPAFRQALDDDVLLVSIQLANPEIGTIQDVRAVSDAAHARDISVHCDAVDAVGWMPV